jgi:lysophospholipase
MFRRGLPLILALLLCACRPGDSRDPYTDSRIPPSLGQAFWPPEGWTWGLLQIGRDPPQRYGVAAAPGAIPIAQALMLPGYGGTAEETFATANLLLGRRIQVWALDGIGQGGSGRLTLPRDLGHLKSFDGDLAGLRRMVDEVIRPRTEAPLVAIADRTAAPVLLRALQLGLPGVAAVVLTEPRLSAAARAPLRAGPPWASWSWFDLSWVRSPGESGWRRATEGGAQGSPGYVRHAWQLANPDLRMGGPSLGWLAAFAQLTAAVRATGWTGASVPVLVLGDPAAPARQVRAEAELCRALPRCTLERLSPDLWPQREAAFVLKVASAGPEPDPSLPKPTAGR